MAQVLELAQLLQHDGVAEVDVRRRRVEAQLGPQLAALAPRRPPAWPAGLPRAATRRRCAPGRRRPQRGFPSRGNASVGRRRDALRRLIATTPQRPVDAASPPPHERRVRIEHHAAVRRSRAAGATRARSPARQEAPAAGHLPAARPAGHRLDAVRDDDGRRVRPAGPREPQGVPGRAQLGARGLPGPARSAS